MTSFTIYDSEGNKYTSEGRTNDKNRRIENLSLGAVRLTVETTRQGQKVTFYFRAKETASGRTEMFYAVYESKEAGNLAQDFQQRVDQLGLILDDVSSTAAYNLISGQQSGDINVRNENMARWVMQQGDRLILGASSLQYAVEAMKYYAQSGPEKVAVVKGLPPDVLDGFDVIVKVGEGTGTTVAPAGESKRAIEQEQERRKRERKRRQNSSSINPLNVASLLVIVIGGLLLVMYGLATFGVATSVSTCVPGVSGDACFLSSDDRPQDTISDDRPQATIVVSREGSQGPLTVNVSSAKESNATGYSLRLENKNGPQVFHNRSLNNSGSLHKKYYLPQGNWSVVGEIYSDNDAKRTTLNSTNESVTVDYPNIERLTVDNKSFPSVPYLRETGNSWENVTYQVELNKSLKHSNTTTILRVKANDTVVKQYNRSELSTANWTVNGSLTSGDAEIRNISFEFNSEASEIQDVTVSGRLRKSPQDADGANKMVFPTQRRRR